MLSTRHLVAVLLLLLLWPAFAPAQADDKVTELHKRAAEPFAGPQATAPADPAQASVGTSASLQSGFHTYRITQENNKLYDVLILSLLALTAHFMVMHFLNKRAEFAAAYIVNATGLIFIIFGTVIVVVIADTEQQLTAAIGVMGAIAGYLFGTLRRDAAPAPHQSDQTRSSS